MDRSDIVNGIIDIIRQEAALIGLSDRFIDLITEIELRNKLLNFKQDHKRHIQMLIDIVNNTDIMGGPVIIGEINSDDIRLEKWPDSQNQIISELLLKEENLSSAYRKIMILDIDFKTDEIMDNNLEDEFQHVSFLHKVKKDLG